MGMKNEEVLLWPPSRKQVRRRLLRLVTRAKASRTPIFGCTQSAHSFQKWWRTLQKRFDSLIFPHWTPNEQTVLWQFSLAMIDISNNRPFQNYCSIFWLDKIFIGSHLVVIVFMLEANFCLVSSRRRCWFTQIIVFCLINEMMSK